MHGCGGNSAGVTRHEHGSLCAGANTVFGCVRACRKREGARFSIPRMRGDPKLREELESRRKQPRSTTVIGMSNEDAARGKVLSPIAGFPRELIPADISVSRRRGLTI